MKKLLYLIAIFTILIPITCHAAVATSSDKRDLNIYLFTDDECETCNEEQKWLEEKYQNDTQVYIKIINVKNQNEIYTKTRDILNIKKENVPVTVIGSNYFYGFSNSMKKTLEEVVDTYLKNDQYCNVIAKIQDNKEIEDCMNQNKEIYHPKTGLSTLVKIVLGMVGIGFVVGMIFLIQKKKLLSRLHR